MSTKIMPVTDLRRKTRDVIRGVQEDGDTVYITQHGRPAVVLIDYERFEDMVSSLREKELSEPAYPTAEQKRAAALLQSWIDEGDAVEQAATGEALQAGLDENRLSDRQLFPPDQEGKSW
ncbi:MAG: type II toxin-antitoxin system prevent-host-death family antitoxin [Chloroflexota bacterium]